MQRLEPVMSTPTLSEYRNETGQVVRRCGRLTTKANKSQNRAMWKAVCDRCEQSGRWTFSYETAAADLSAHRSSETGGIPR